MPKNSLPDGYSKVSFTYDDKKLEGYQYVQKGVTYAYDNDVKGSDFYLIYAINEETGKEGLYVYDKLENTIQRYNPSLLLYYEQKLSNAQLYFYISLGVIAVLIITFAIVLITKGKNKKRR